MNKKIFYLLILFLLIITLFDIKMYVNTKKKVLKENTYLINLETKIKKIYALEKKYKFNNYLFTRLNNFCKITQNNEKYSLNCQNLDRNKFNMIQNIIFKNNFKIISFEIKKTIKANIQTEINK